MGFMDQAKNMYNLQKQAKQIKKELKNIHVEAEHDGVVVVVDGEQNMVECRIPEMMLSDAVKLGKAVAEATNKAIKKSQMIAAEKMQAVMGSMGLGGLMGQ